MGFIHSIVYKLRPFERCGLFTDFYDFLCRPLGKRFLNLNGYVWPPEGAITKKETS